MNGLTNIRFTVNGSTVALSADETDHVFVEAWSDWAGR